MYVLKGWVFFNFEYCVKHFKCCLPFAPPTVERICNMSSGGEDRERRDNSFSKEVKISKGLQFE